MERTDTLGTPERSDVWISTLNGALYRWEGDEKGWYVQTKYADYHPIKAGIVIETVYGQAGEHFDPIHREVNE